MLAVKNIFKETIGKHFNQDVLDDLFNKYSQFKKISMKKYSVKNNTAYTELLLSPSSAGVKVSIYIKFNKQIIVKSFEVVQGSIVIDCSTSYTFLNNINSILLNIRNTTRQCVDLYFYGKKYQFAGFQIVDNKVVNNLVDIKEKHSCGQITLSKEQSNLICSIIAAILEEKLNAIIAHSMLEKIILKGEY